MAELAGETGVLQIQSLVRSARRLLRLSWITTGLALTVGIACATTLVASLTDLAVPLPVPLRVAAFLVIVVPTAVALIVGVFAPAARRLSANSVARRIERGIPKIQSRLVTTIDLASSGGSARLPSPTFFNRLVTETVDQVRGFRPLSIVNREHLTRASLFAAMAALLFILGFAFWNDRMPTALARIYLPLADIPPASGVVYTVAPGDAKFLKGDAVSITATLEKGETHELFLEFRELAHPSNSGKPAPAKWVRYPMMRSAADQFEFTFDQLGHSMQYRLVGGGTWTRRHQIEMLERPVVADLQAVVHYPEYMKLPEPKMGTPRTGDASGPVGSNVEVFANVAGDVATGEIQVLTPVTRMRPVTERRERVWFEGALPAGAKSEGSWQWDHSLKFRAAHTHPPGGGPQSHGFHSAAQGFEVLPGQNLYVYAFIPPGQAPEQIMLQWHDGTNWEHRAYWGADKIQVGSPNSPSRFRAGDLPSPGDWVLLDVPAHAVGLEGKKIYGTSFMTFGGQCKWNRAGTIDPAALPERSFIVEWKYPMQRVEQQSGSAESPPDSGADEDTAVWSGQVPLTRDTLYRVEFKNELGYANKEMKESKLTAIPDNPPQVVLERPGADLVLSAPQKVPLVVRAYDDFGLSDVSLAVQKGDSGGFVGSPIQVFENPTRHESLVAALDLAPHQLKPGEHVRYRVQARDRKGQFAQTPEFVVRIAPADNTADKQLAQLEKQQDSFKQKLAQLIAQQAKVTDTVAELAGRERPAPQDGDKSDDAKSADQKADRPEPAQPQATANAPESKPAPNAELDANMAEARDEIAKLAATQDANLQLASQVHNELNQAATQAAQSRLLPEPIAEQMRAVEQAFKNAAIEAMRDLLEEMRQAANPQAKPDVNAIADQTEQVQEQLESLQDRLDALARAQQRMHDQPAEAMAQLEQELMNQNAQLTARELAELRDMLDRLMGQMQMLEGRENELAKQTKDAKPVMLPEIAAEQAKIETEADRLLAQAERIEDIAPMNQPDSGDASDNASNASEMASDAAMDNAKAKAKSAQAQSNEMGEEMKGADAADSKDASMTEAGDESPSGESDAGEEMAPPGVREKIDPRFANKSDSSKKADASGKESSKDSAKADASKSAAQHATAKNASKDATGKDAAKATGKMAQSQGQAGESASGDLRSELMDRQEQTAEELRTAQEQLRPRRDQLDELAEKLREALNAEGEDAQEQLAELMQSMGAAKALEMAQAMRRTPPTNTAEPQQPNPQDPAAQLVQTLMNSMGSTPNAGMRLGTIADFEGNAIDLAGQTVILRMQPRMREELLKGMREEGPEGYRQFIQDYFNRLTKVKSSQ